MNVRRSFLGWALLALFSSSALGGVVYDPPYANYTVDVDTVNGPITGVTFNGGRADFGDPTNRVTADVVSPATLSRTYSVSFEADPGWVFSSITMFVLGQARVGWASFIVGSMTYSIFAEGSATPFSSGVMQLVGGGNPSVTTIQNPTWDFYTEFSFEAQNIPVPASAFRLELTTLSRIFTYENRLEPGANTYVDIMGNSHGSYSFSVNPTMQGATSVPSVPEPGTLALLGLGLAGLGLSRRRNS